MATKKTTKVVEKPTKAEKKEPKILAREFARKMNLGKEMGGVIENWLKVKTGEMFPIKVKKPIGEWQKIWIKMNKEKA